MKILGISAYYHDSSISIIEGDQILFCAQEERFSRVKNDSSFPKRSILEGLKYLDLKPFQVEAIVFYEKPFLKFERLVETHVEFAPFGFKNFVKAIPIWIQEKLFLKELIRQELLELGFSKGQIKKILFSDHHLSHAASAFFVSPFREAIILTMDGVGEWDTTTVYIGKENQLFKKKEIHFPHSLGLLYSAFTYYCGFKVNSGEYKLMGLAPYGQPTFVDVIRESLIQIADDGSFQLNMKYFDYAVGLKMTNSKFDALFGHNFRNPEQELKQVHMDLAASIQSILEEVVLKICRNLKSEFGIENLCLAGGVALNCVANGKIYKENIFQNIWVQPAAGDSGGSLGAALAAHYLHFKNSRNLPCADKMNSSYLGNGYSYDQINEALQKLGARFEISEESEVCEKIAQLLVEQKAVGWFQGRMEFGPRALGNRSILADPRNAEMQRDLNLKVKFRESFRPFAPVVLQESVSDWFDYDSSSPYMLMVAKVLKKHLIEPNTKNSKLFGIELLNQKRSDIAAITHVDNSARLQTVSSDSNPRLHKLISCFFRKTGVPMLINTSFNIRGEPIVCSVEDAYRCFMGTNLDYLVIENFILSKEDQPQNLKKDYRSQIELD